MTEETKPKSGDEAILQQARDRLKSCIDDEKSERAKMLDDLRFACLDQWDSKIRNARETDPNGPRPCLTVDKFNQYKGQVLNDIRQNRPAIKVRPVDDHADVETAKIIQGLIRHIEDQSSASIAYETAADWSVTCGQGYFRVTTDYVSPESFDQEIFIRRIPNMFSVYLGPHTMPDGSDADYGFVFEDVPVERFKREYPGKKFKSADFEMIGTTDWCSAETVRVAEYFYKEYSERELLFLADGQSMFAEEWLELPEDVRSPVSVDKDGNEQRRKTQTVSVKWCKHTGIEVLEKRDWAGKYIPIVEVIGKEAYVEGKRVVWGLVRPSKDSLRAYNYWISTITEKIGLSPKSPFIAAEGQLEGKEQEWGRANVENRAFLTYKPVDVNGNAVPPPRRQEPSQVEAGMMAMLPLLEHDVQTSLGMFKASVGESESQQSGRAILALQRESDTGTFHFADNLSKSIQYLGRILVDLAPKIYDTKRTMRIVGEDGEISTATIDKNQPEAIKEFKDQAGEIQRIYNLDVGKFDVTVTTGPSYNTKRMEAAEVMLEMVKSQPELMKVMGHIMFSQMDFPGADEIAKVMKRMMPPELQEKDGPPIPPQAVMQIQQLGQAVQLLQQENQELQSGERQAQAKIQAAHREKMAEFALQQAEQQEKARLERDATEEKARLARESAEEKARLARWEAEEQMKLKVWLAQQEVSIDRQKAANQAATTQ